MKKMLIFMILWLLIGVFVVYPYVENKALIMMIGGFLGALQAILE